MSNQPSSQPLDLSVHQPRLVIHYCRQCRWLLRAAWYTQELLTTFGEQLGEIALAPTTGGVFRITLDEQTIWDRKTMGGFPDIKVLKQRVRDEIAPQMQLGHSDTDQNNTDQNNQHDADQK